MHRPPTPLKKIFFVRWWLSGRTFRPAWQYTSTKRTPAKGYTDETCNATQTSELVCAERHEEEKYNVAALARDYACTHLLQRDLHRLQGLLLALRENLHDTFKHLKLILKHRFDRLWPQNCVNSSIYCYNSTNEERVKLCEEVSRFNRCAEELVHRMRIL